MSSTVHLEDVGNDQDEASNVISENVIGNQSDTNGTESGNVTDDQVDTTTIVSENIAGTPSDTNNIASGDVSEDEDSTADGPYDDLSEETLAQLASRRGLGTVAEIVTRAIVQQDRDAEWLQSFKFTDLPPELRNLIYIHAMVEKRRRLRLPDVDVAGLKLLRKHFPRVGHEMLGIYLGYNTFELDVEMTYYGPEGLNYALARSDHKQLHQFQFLRRYLRKLVINLDVEVVPLREQFKVQMTLECVPMQIEQTRVEQYTVQTVCPREWGWISDTAPDGPQRGISDHVRRHAQAYFDDIEKDFKFTLNGLTKFLAELPSFYDPQ